jgi:subtilisin family serine protease
VLDVAGYEPMASDDRVIGVANCHRKEAKLVPHRTSNYGDTLDLCAIGNGSWTINAGCSGAASPCPFGGTSAAAANVSGTVGLMLSVKPCLTFKQVREILVETSRTQPYEPINSHTYGAGVLNTFAAVTAAKNAACP